MHAAANLRAALAGGRPARAAMVRMFAIALSSRQTKRIPVRPTSSASTRSAQPPIQDLTGSTPNCRTSRGAR